jgi:hypothetical protein
MPPLAAWALQPLINRAWNIFTLMNTMMLSIVLTIIMSMAYPEAYPTFVLYFFIFNFLMLFYSRSLLNNSKGLSLAIYTCFAISVLWEWPIQITIPQNETALALSGFKALGIPFFFFLVYKEGWRPAKKDILYIGIPLLIGAAIAESILVFGPGTWIYITHLYRFLWLPVFFAGVNRIRKHKTDLGDITNIYNTPG